MKIILLGPAHPYRGGIATIIETMAREFISRGDEVRIETFSLQYPAFLFPGESQYSSSAKPQDLRICRSLNTVNPLNWVALGRRLKRERPDLVILKYWTPFMAPAFGTVARIARQNGHTKFICQIDNVEPHESRWVDAPLNRYFLRSIDGFIHMSAHVGEELKRYTNAPSLFSPHPIFDNLGERIPKAQACKALDLDPLQRYALFFGLVRDYKGLDLLLKAWAHAKFEGRKLIVAGEFYTSEEPYLKLIEELGIGEDVVLHQRFIPDGEVLNYFSASDFIVLPYRTATQSGVTQIAYNFNLPMIVTSVGGLPEIVPNDRVGIVCSPTVDSISAALVRAWGEDGLLQRFADNFPEERKRFSWSAMCDKVMAVYRSL